MKLVFTVVCAASLLLGGAPTCWSQTRQKQKLTASDGEPGDWFGYSVGISPTLAVVGARADDDLGSFAGSAYVFDLKTGAELHKLLASDGQAGDAFGRMADVDGNISVIGAPLHDGLGSNSGATYVFDIETGVEIFLLQASDGSAGDFFGWPAIDAGRVVIGASGDDDLGSESGSSYVFNATTGSPLRKLTASDGAPGDGFGAPVALEAGYALIGAIGADDLGTDSGSAYVFDVESGVQLRKLTPSDGGPGDRFGWSAATDGSRAVVGAPNKGAGAAYVFDLETGLELFKLAASDGVSGDEFGRTVALWKQRIVVGADRSDDFGADSGSVYVFDLGTGQELFKLNASDSQAGDRFGVTVAASSGMALIAAFTDDDMGVDSGSAYVFDITVDCNGNGIDDSTDIEAGSSEDTDSDGVPDECQCNVQPYCETSPNSVGPGARIRGFGEPRIGSVDFRIEAALCPPRQFGVFFFGPIQTQFPFGDGWRCIGGGLTRLFPVQRVGDGGSASMFLETTVPPLDAVRSLTTLNFQFWYRDPKPVGFGFNLSDGLEVTFCPTL